VWSAAYLVRGMVSAMDRLDALAYWTVSDHFEELGRPPQLLHGGFGLLAVGNLRKPRWWALWMLEQLGQSRLRVGVEGDAAGDMVDAVAALHDTGRVTAVIWNGTVDVSKSEGLALLDREVTMTIIGLDASEYRVRHRRLDHEHSDLNASWQRIADGRAWPDEDDWRQLFERDVLEDYEPPTRHRAEGGRLTLTFPLPMPSVSLVELEPLAR
jgi:xylan 1,4-beta-xylosidase